jgi:multiple sugar transport system substrate-binding protein
MARPRSILPAAILAIVLGSLDGCDGPPQPQQPAPGAAANGNNRSSAGAAGSLTLRLLIVGDPALSQKITRLRGEWSARSGASLEISDSSPADLAKAKSLAADVVIYPSAELGTLVQRRMVRALPPAWLDRPGYQKADLLELPGLRETAWGEQTYAVPLGSPVFVCFYRSDLFERFNRRPPQTWVEYQALVEFFAGQMKSKATATASLHFPALEPLAKGWAGNVLLARAAAYAKHRDYYSTLFDKDSLEPRIASEPFVRALTELVATAKLGPKAQLDCAPSDVRREFFAGHAAMALSWPTAADSMAPPREPSGAARATAGSPAGTSAAPSAVPASAVPASAVPASAVPAAASVGFVELPGSLDVFNPRDRQWLSRKPDDEPHVPLLAVAGRMGSVVRGTSAADAAFELLVWLAGKEWSTQVSTASSATTLFRRSQLKQPERWVESGMSPAAAAQYAVAAAQSFSRSSWLFAARLPGHEQYMAALDDAVRGAIANSVTPEAALAKAATRWQEITDRLGRAEQHAAYSRSLGLEP